MTRRAAAPRPAWLDPHRGARSHNARSHNARARGRGCAGDCRATPPRRTGRARSGGRRAGALGRVSPRTADRPRSAAIDAPLSYTSSFGCFVVGRAIRDGRHRRGREPRLRRPVPPPRARRARVPRPARLAGHASSTTTDLRRRPARQRPCCRPQPPPTRVPRRPRPAGTRIALPPSHGPTVRPWCDHDNRPPATCRGMRTARRIVSRSC